jgi:hypothetical protein
MGPYLVGDVTKDRSAIRLMHMSQVKSRLMSEFAVDFMTVAAALLMTWNTSTRQLIICHRSIICLLNIIGGNARVQPLQVPAGDKEGACRFIRTA